MADLFSHHESEQGKDGKMTQGHQHILGILLRHLSSFHSPLLHVTVLRLALFFMDLSWPPFLLCLPTLLAFVPHYVTCKMTIKFKTSWKILLTRVQNSNCGNKHRSCSFSPPYYLQSCAAIWPTLRNTFTWPNLIHPSEAQLKYPMLNSPDLEIETECSILWRKKFAWTVRKTFVTLFDIYLFVSLFPLLNYELLRVRYKCYPSLFPLHLLMSRTL